LLLDLDIVGDHRDNKVEMFDWVFTLFSLVAAMGWYIYVYGAAM